MNSPEKFNTEAYLALCQRSVNTALDKQLKALDKPAPILLKAMRYGVFNGGKRLRPVLAYASGQAVTNDINRRYFAPTDIAACAVEFIHSYSLIHDDLPAMDNDDLRRGKPTNHKAFDEATAILAGDALQALAFQLISESALLRVGHKIRLTMLTILCKAVGGAGMVAGQSIDLIAVGKQISPQQLETLHRLKTAALIRASVQLGALSTGVASAAQLQALSNYADFIGLAFQVQDDILDVQSNTATLGKQQGADQALNKPTYVSLLGIAGAKQKARQLCQQAIDSLEIFAESGMALRAIAGYIVQRNY